MTSEETFAQWESELTELLRELLPTIRDEYRASGDERDANVTPAMDVTIATDDKLSRWVYQTGDNSFTGACYSMPYWGVGALARGDDPAEIAAAILDDLRAQMEFVEVQP